MNRGAALHGSTYAPGGPPDNAAAALRGASLAFYKKPGVASPSSSAVSLPLSSSPPPQNRAKDDGALTAALSVAKGPKRPPPSRAPVNRGSPDGVSSVNSASNSSPDRLSPTPQPGFVAARLQQLHPAPAKLDPKNPSFIAATLAASRSVSPKPKGSGLRSKSSHDLAVDAGPIASTGSLISLFDQPTSPATDSTPDDNRRAQHMAVNRFMAAPPRSLPKPARPPTPPPVERHRKPSVSTSKQPPAQSPRRSSPAHFEAENSTPTINSELRSKHRGSLPIVGSASPVKSRPLTPPPKQRLPQAKSSVKPLVTRPLTPPPVVRSTPRVLSPKPVRLVTPKLTASPRIDAQLLDPRPVFSPSADPSKRSSGSKPKPQVPLVKPSVSQQMSGQPVRRNEQLRGADAYGGPPQASTSARAAASSNSSPSISSSTPPKSPSPPPLPRRRQTRRATPPSPPLELTRRHHSNASASTLQLDSLASAIMAGSLASSRLTPQSTGASLSVHTSRPSTSGHTLRQKSPRMLQTLRQAPTSVVDESDQAKKGRRHKLRKGKHAHHEGSRKRWREEMTEKERKRYEAVWASNRGWLLNQGATASASGRDGSECVANVAVRELWKRSRLPEDELAEVWDLVDRGGQGMLTRPEFVVGMWLIDQRLRGRKLPHRVSDSLWGSANGVTVMKPKTRRT